MTNDPQVINTLRTKASELERHIGKLEKALARAKADLSHINASITLFNAPAAGEQFPLHFNLGRLFKGRELGALCREALSDGPKDTRELAAYVIAAKGLDADDRLLRNSIQLRIVNAMRMAEKRRTGVVRHGKRGAAVVWGLGGCN
ncbi:hypothetical protein [Pelagibacterium montanilacus]|uniref:hypothetical protein n=1 Tax=Pelagibacterium montanilacus TaxID=2185280 RepID=UPI000F8D9CBB|nr:hypothetical protein [Pelagibacterium montanilacus]